MRTLGLLGAIAISAVALAACDRDTAFNNTGNSASPSPERLVPSTAPNVSTATNEAPAASGDRSALDETATTGRIKAAIAADEGLRDSDISVSTRGGVVTLEGTAKSPDQVALATAVAQRQEGVERVETQVTVVQ